MTRPLSEPGRAAQSCALPANTFPQYIKPISQNITGVDLDFLRKKGAFAIPDRAFRDNLLRCFVHFVHPFLPVVELQKFLTAIVKDRSTDAVSLLLFHAVMFAATAYVDMDCLNARGYKSRRIARRTFFQRAKLLYDFGCEPDRVTVVQSILLMTDWHESPHDPRDVWHWLDVAVSVAKTARIHCLSSYPAFSDSSVRRCWRRIWWCCYMRDRLIAIGMRFPARINNADFDIPMLNLSDFETDELPSELTQTLGLHSDVLDTSTRLALAELCIGLAKLCLCISQVLRVQHSNLNDQTPTRPMPMKRPPSKSFAVNHGDVLQCDRELEIWYRSQPQVFSNCQRRPDITKGRVIDLHRAVLTCVYLTTINTLHRPQTVPSAQEFLVWPELKAMSKRKVCEAANDITHIFKDLYTRHLIQCLPNTSITCLLPAMIVHLLEARSTDSGKRVQSIQNFQFCMQALHQLADIYLSAECAFRFLSSAVPYKSSGIFPTTSPLAKACLPLESPTVPCNDSRSQSEVILSPPESELVGDLFRIDSPLVPEDSILEAFCSSSNPECTLTLHEAAEAAVRLDTSQEQPENDLGYRQEDFPWISLGVLTGLEGRSV